MGSRIARWLSYADSCVQSDAALARCQPFWNFVGVLLALLCVAAVAGAVVAFLMDRRKKRGAAPASRPLP